MAVVRTVHPSSLTYLADPSFCPWATNPRKPEELIATFEKSGQTPTDILFNDIKEAGSWIREGQHRKLTSFFDEHKISRSPHPLWQLASAYTMALAPLKEESVWEILYEWSSPLIDTLITCGYLVDGLFRPITTASDGIALVTLISKHCPKDWDLLDALAFLRGFHSGYLVGRSDVHDVFGSWKPRGKKDILASLRCLATFESDYTGLFVQRKIEALCHPLFDRGNQLTLTSERLMKSLQSKDNNERTAKVEKLSRDHTFALIIPRLKVELYVADLFLKQHPEWLRRLYPQLTDDEFISECKSLLERTNLIRTAIDHLSGELKTSV